MGFCPHLQLALKEWIAMQSYANMEEKSTSYYMPAQADR